MEGKVCTKCKQWKLLEEFNKNKHHKDGRQYECRECTKKYNKQWRENNIDHVKEYKKQWNKNNPECQKKYNKQWRENNPEYDKQYKEVNKEKIKEYFKGYGKQYRKDNAEHIKEICKQYRQDNAEYNKQYYKQYYKDNVEYFKQYRQDNAEHIKQYYKDNAEHLKEYYKQWYDDIKENNLQHISSIVEQINPIFAELNLPIYGYIYKFENIKTGKCYIGQTIKPLAQRYRTEIVKGWIEDRKHYQRQKFLNELIEEDIIVTEVLDVAFCKYHLDKLETYYIQKYDSCNNGYNNEYGNHNTNDGLEEFQQILSTHNLEYKDGKIIKSTSSEIDQ